MEYVTVYETFANSEAHILSNIFRDQGLKFRLMDERTNDIVPIGIRLQVIREHQERALLLMRENGFLQKNAPITGDVPIGKFWIYLFLALIIVIIVGVVIALARE